jgi:hypothetical protein
MGQPPAVFAQLTLDWRLTHPTATVIELILASKSKSDRHAHGGRLLMVGAQQRMI